MSVRWHLVVTAWFFVAVTSALGPIEGSTISVTSSTTSGKIKPVSETNYFAFPATTLATGTNLTWDWDMMAEGVDRVKGSSSETKFIMTSSGPAGKTLLGPTPPPATTLTGTRGSLARVSGSGSSGVFGFGWVTWTVDAGTSTGTLPPPPAQAFYSSTLKGKDPFFWTAQDFADAGITDTTYDHYLNVGIDACRISVDSTDSGWGAFNAFYETASESWSLLDVAFGLDGVSVTSEGPSGLQFYELSSIDSDPVVDPTKLLSVGEIERILSDDFLADGVLDNPLYLGISLNGIAVPTLDMGDGYVCKTGGSSGAHSEGAIPEPTALAIWGAFGALCLIAARRRNRAE